MHAYTDGHVKQIGYSSRGPHLVPLFSTKNRKLRLLLTLPGLMSLDFCCNIKMVESVFGVYNIKTWIRVAAYQRHVNLPLMHPTFPVLLFHIKAFK